MHILSLQPYFGGSHQAFQTGWQRHSRHDWTVLTLPPRHWKWRMRHAAVEFARQLYDANAADYDAVVCSDFLNVAEFRGLVDEPFRRLPLVLYFHENQFAYPSRRYDERDLHFGFTNFTSCLAADQIWFNSAWNRDSFFVGLERACQKWPDYQPIKSIETIRTKCRIEPPGINVPPAEISRPSDDASVSILWASRWEHDKNPGLLLEALREFRNRDLPFRLNVIGQSFRRVPEEFEQIRAEFAGQIERWGYQQADDYWLALQEADAFISTADHEFFGIAAAEAIACGLFPLLPDRLAYPELIRTQNDSRRADLCLYDGTAQDLAQKLEYFVRHGCTEEMQELRIKLQLDLVAELAWLTRAPKMDAQIEGICASFCPIG
ncbi:MAG: tRNA-queuosine alpha-mannosyltransferase domain-containing protein [Pirellulaceae bacterium]